MIILAMKRKCPSKVKAKTKTLFANKQAQKTIFIN